MAKTANTHDFLQFMINVEAEKLQADLNWSSSW